MICSVDGILYRVGKTERDPWRLVIPRLLEPKYLNDKILHDSKWAGHS